MDLLAQLITWINKPVNALGKTLLAPIMTMPGWASNTIISAITGVVLLIIFKYTSNQKAIGRVKDDVKANLLALKLFKDSVAVTLAAEGRLFKSAFKLLYYAVVPLLVMIVPVILLLAQMSLWYQSKPLSNGQQTVVTMKLNGDINASWPDVHIEPSTATEVTLGPVRVLTNREICWNITPLQNGYHTITFDVDGEKFQEELAVGSGFMRISSRRPAWSWLDILQHPAEEPLSPDVPVKSISIDYPDCASFWGIGWWLIYFFVVSMVFAFLLKPFLKVKI